MSKHDETDELADEHAHDDEVQQDAVQDMVRELVTCWGYRDVTALLTQWHERRLDYVCILQTPQGGPVYCRTRERLYAERDRARAAAHAYAQCPAPDPRAAMWMVVGNFDLDET